MSYHEYLNQWFLTLAVRKSPFKFNNNHQKCNKTRCPWPIFTESESTEVLSKHVWGDDDTQPG